MTIPVWPIFAAALTAGQCLASAALDTTDATAASPQQHVMIVQASGDGEPQVITLDGAECPPGMLMLTKADVETQGPEGKLIKRMMVTAAASPVWLGVRLTPVPAPLAAHLDAQGVMVGNVIVDSPADKAGLQQYDVITSLNGTAVTKFEDLTNALTKNGANQQAKLGIVRAGKRMEVRITPSDRPTDPAVMNNLKYEEQDDLLQHNAVTRGLTMQLGPDGKWEMRDLGDLQNMPDALKTLQDHLQELNIGFDWTCDDNGSFPPGQFQFFGTGDNGQTQTELQRQIKIEVEQDGTHLSIGTDADGQFNVTRTDADGNVTTNTYDNAESLEQADPEAYKLVAPHVGGGATMFFQALPFGQGGALRQQFQSDVHKRLQEALAKAGVAGGPHQADVRVEMKIDDQGNETQDLAGVVRGADGHIMVITREDGAVQTHEFNSLEELKQNPELYEKVKSHFE